MSCFLYVEKILILFLLTSLKSFFFFSNHKILFPINIQFFISISIMPEPSCLSLVFFIFYNPKLKMIRRKYHQSFSCVFFK